MSRKLYNAIENEWANACYLAAYNRIRSRQTTGDEAASYIRGRDLHSYIRDAVLTNIIWSLPESQRQTLFAMRADKEAIAEYAAENIGKQTT